MHKEIKRNDVFVSGDGGDGDGGGGVDVFGFSKNGMKDISYIQIWIVLWNENASDIFTISISIWIMQSKWTLTTSIRISHNRILRVAFRNA